MFKIVYCIGKYNAKQMETQTSKIDMKQRYKEVLSSTHEL